MRRLDTLDGMRGIAALSILVFHVFRSVLSPQFSGGYLAVDLFFMLSGFVIARTYEDRLANGLSAQSFMQLRIKRLLPVIWFGIVLGALQAIFRGAPIHATQVQLVMQLLFIPALFSGTELFPLNGVQWSLFFELTANLAHALFFRKASLAILAAIIAVAFIALAWYAYGANSVWLGVTRDTFLGGFPRMVFSYCVGIFVFRCTRSGKLSVPAVPGAIVMALLPAVFVLDQVAKGYAPGWIVDLAMVSLCLPALLIFGANATLRPVGQRLAEVGGYISYPLYAIHLPVVMLGQLAMLSRTAETVFAFAASIGIAGFVAACLEPRPSRAQAKPADLVADESKIGVLAT